MGTGIATEDRRASGEAEVTRALRRLPDEWVALHDVAWPGRPQLTIDHVVVGPGGVFVIEAESWAGTIEVRDQVLTEDGRSREQAVDLAARAAIAVQHMVPRRCFPVVCFAGAPLSGWAREVMICSAPTVRLLLMSRPHRLDPDDVRLCVEALQAASGHRAAAAGPTRAKAASPRPSTGRTLLAFVGMLVLLVALLSGAVQNAADWVGNSYVSETTPDDEQVTRPRQQKRDPDRPRQDAGR